eukprot:1159481-Pelagomonas_calceolata.AAC.7
MPSTEQQDEHQGPWRGGDIEPNWTAPAPQGHMLTYVPFLISQNIIYLKGVVTEVKMINEQLCSLRGTARLAADMVKMINRWLRSLRGTARLAADMVKMINERLRSLRGTARLAVDMVQPIRPEMARAFHMERFRNSVDEQGGSGFKKSGTFAETALFTG